MKIIILALNLIFLAIAGCYAQQEETIDSVISFAGTKEEIRALSLINGGCRIQKIAPIKNAAEFLSPCKGFKKYFISSDNGTYLLAENIVIFFKANSDKEISFILPESRSDYELRRICSDGGELIATDYYRNIVVIDGEKSIQQSLNTLIVSGTKLSVLDSTLLINNKTTLVCARNLCDILPRVFLLSNNRVAVKNEVYEENGKKLLSLEGYVYDAFPFSFGTILATPIGISLLSHDNSLKKVRQGAYPQFIGFLKNGDMLVKFEKDGLVRICVNDLSTKKISLTLENGASVGVFDGFIYYTKSPNRILTKYKY
jgi:hypothetical protein